jgi:hypothetical protein
MLIKIAGINISSHLYVFFFKLQVIRRWSHRWHKSGKETQFRYDQIAKLIEFGLLCQEKDPCKRPFVSDIIHVINELECAGRHSNANGSTLAQVLSRSPHNFNSSSK